MLPSALAPPERQAHLLGEEDADGKPRFELLEAGDLGEQPPPPCASTSNRTAAYRS